MGCASLANVCARNKGHERQKALSTAREAHVLTREWPTSVSKAPSDASHELIVGWMAHTDASMANVDAMEALLSRTMACEVAR
jgi:hypothetical protein